MTRRRFPGSFNIPAIATALQWESLTFLRTIGLLRLGYFGTVLIPIFAYFVQAWNTWATVNPPALPLSLPGSMFVAYVGSVLLSVGQLLNEVFCPPLIKIHGTLRSFQVYLGEHVAHERAIAEAARTANERDIDEKARIRLPEMSEQHRNRLVNALTDVILDKKAESSSPDEGSVIGYRKVWDDANNRFVLVRWAIAFCYMTAAALAALLIAWQIPHMFSLVVEAL